MEKDVSICVIMCCLGGGSVGQNVGGSAHEPDKESGKGKGGEEGTGTAGGDPWKCVPQMKITFFQTLSEIQKFPHDPERFEIYTILLFSVKLFLKVAVVEDLLQRKRDAFDHSMHFGDEIGALTRVSIEQLSVTILLVWRMFCW